MIPTFPYNSIDDQSTENKISYVYFLKSPCFPDNSYKLTVSKASPDDIITAHKDVYCCTEEDKTPEFTVDDIRVIRDKDLFASSIATLDRIRDNFLLSETKGKIVKIIDAINSLVTLYDQTEVDTEKYVELVVSEDVACFDVTKEPQPVDSESQFVELNNNIVTVTRLLEIKDIAAKQQQQRLKQRHPDIVVQPSWNPVYN